MHIILGATGRVGGEVAAQLVSKGEAVVGISHSREKAAALKEKGMDAAIADARDLTALRTAFRGGTALFIITPETGQEQDVLAETRHILDNYREAAQQAGIQKIVGISSMGAQYEKGTGNLQMSYMLEHAFEDLPVTQIFIRPAYYYSNWLPYLHTVKETGVLPSFYPAGQRISMIAPADVGRFAATVMTADEDKSTLYEIEGPQQYTPQDVADAFGKLLNKTVTVQQIPKAAWEKTLESMHFSPDAVKNFVEMTEAVLDGRAAPERNGIGQVKGRTSLEAYLKCAITTP
ncbi:MAG TPA: NmrA family NAD(P)-binding protein [Chitinophaga sp.]|uniref:NmrA family NAD(P)-binding protein n=1 Tax=Chitinophaga sp. TaxID=1869181 RepID=UPI002DBEE80E|nr:NmrA family NAD(P)-binding protein [Chitinophaga sp.]HEU4552891.1 NmrA family NAD(P)-binding protein [Chitinophaga sp.]